MTGRVHRFHPVDIIRSGSEPANLELCLTPSKVIQPSSQRNNSHLLALTCNAARMAYLPDSREALQADIADAVASAIETRLPDIVRRATQKPYLTKRELMDLTGWSARQVEYKKSKRELPFVRRGRTVLFPTEEVYAYLKEGYVPASRPRD